MKALMFYLLSAFAPGAAAMIVISHAYAGEPVDIARFLNTPSLFDHGALSVSPDGGHVAFVVKEDKGEEDRAIAWGRLLPNDVAKGFLDTRLFIASANGGAVTEICPDHRVRIRPTWSPNGEQIAFYSDQLGYMSAWLYDLSRRECRPLGETRIRAKMSAALDGPKWSPDGKRVYVNGAPLDKPVGYYHEAENVKRRAAIGEASAGDALEFYASGAERDAAMACGEIITEGAGFGETFYRTLHGANITAIEVSSGDAAIIQDANTRPFPAVARLSPSGRWVSGLSVYVEKPDISRRVVYDLFITPAAGGEPTVIERDIPVSFLDFFDYIYAWSPAGDQLFYVNGDACYLVRVEATGPNGRRSLCDGLESLVTEVHHFSEDGEKVIVGRVSDLTNQSNTGLSAVFPNELVEIDIATGARRALAIDPRLYKNVTLIKTEQGAAWRPSGGDVALAAHNIRTGEAAILIGDFETGRIRAAWSGVGRLGQPVASSATDRLFAGFESTTIPPSIMAFDRALRKMRPLHETVAKKDRFPIGRIQSFTTRAPQHDGRLMDLKATVILPPDYDPKSPPPAVVAFYPDSDPSRMLTRYGGPSFAVLNAALYNSRGYAVLYAYAKVGPGNERGDIIDELVDSLLPQVYKAAALNLVDIDRLALTGNSAGGFGTAAIITQTNIFRAAIPVNGVYDWASHIYGAAPDHDAKLENALTRFGGRHLWDDRWRYLVNSPLYLADKIETPVLIMQGREDWLRPESEKLFTALNRLGKPAQLAIYPNAGHVIDEWPTDQAIAATERIFEFLDRHVKNAPTGARD